MSITENYNLPQHTKEQNDLMEKTTVYINQSDEAIIGKKKTPADNESLDKKQAVETEFDYREAKKTGKLETK